MTATLNRTIRWLSWGVIFLFFITDRIIKTLFIRSESFTQKDYINEFIAFNIKIPQPLISITISVILVWLLFEVYRSYRAGMEATGVLLLMIVAGGIGNAIDRVLYGGVIDYLETFSWFPVFNISDTLITCGAVGIMYTLLFPPKRHAD